MRTCAVVLLAIHCVLGPLPALAGENEQSTPQTRELAEQLLKPEAFEALQQERAQRIAALIAILNGGGEPVRPHRATDVRLKAAELLGCYRAVEAIPSLYAQLEQLQPSCVDARSLETMYPCSLALIAIGKPAALAGCEELKKENSPLRQTLILHIIRGVEGEAGGLLLIRQAINRTDHFPALGRLDEARKEFQRDLMWETKSGE